MLKVKRTMAVLLVIQLLVIFNCYAQFTKKEINWTKDGKAFYHVDKGTIYKIIPGAKVAPEVLVTAKQLTPAAKPTLEVASFDLSNDDNLLLIFTNTARVWRYNTRGDYWLLNRASGKLRQVGKDKPAQTLMYAKISPDGKKVAYVSDRNIYVEDITTGTSKALTTDGNRQLINGTFDWVYEEEFGCRDGFRWSPDSKNIAYWQVDARQTRDYLMLNTTDSIYSFVIPVEYPKVGESPSMVRLGVVNADGGKTLWMQVPGDAREHYLPRMEWDKNEGLIVQQLNRKQNESKLFSCTIATGAAKLLYTETDKAWIDIKSRWNDDDPVGWEWIENGNSFLWVSEKDGWQHIYKISRDGKKEILLTNGTYDIETISAIDEKNNYVYFIASPDNPVQRYLYRVKMDGKSTKAELVTTGSLKGTHSYEVSPGALYALHSFTNRNTPMAYEWVQLPAHKPLSEEESIANTAKPDPAKKIEFFTITTEDGITMDGWIAPPKNFDPAKKYPLVLYVYGEPGSATVDDNFYVGSNRLFAGNMADSGYFYVSFNNRGTPTLKGAAWRKSIYRKIGTLNIRDQAMGVKKLLQERPYLDPARVASWGWSGGGSSTLNLLFQYPDIFQTGIAIAAVGSQLTYDNIYQERYMGIPQENREDFVKGSPITYAKNLKGNLLYVHGTGDDNVHYQNAELLLNELIKYNKQFQFMAYPNRTHSIREGEGTTEHLKTLYTNYLLKYCPPGAR